MARRTEAERGRPSPPPPSPSLTDEQREFVDDLAAVLGHGLLALCAASRIVGIKGWENLYHYVHPIPGKEHHHQLVADVLRSLLLAGPRLDSHPELAEWIVLWQGEKMDAYFEAESARDPTRA